MMKQIGQFTKRKLQWTGALVMLLGVMAIVPWRAIAQAGGGTWTTKASMPTVRLAGDAAAVDGLVYAVGGFNDIGGFNLFAANDAYDPVTDTWSTKAPMPTARYVLAAAAVNGIVYAVGGNNVGQVTGFSQIGGYTGPFHPFLYQNGTMYDLAFRGVAGGINASGQVVGRSGPHAFVWTPFKPNGTSGNMVDLNPLTGVTYSSANAINTVGVVVGNATDAGDQFAFIWDSVNGMRNLNTLIPAGSGWVLERATGINDFEQIVGTGTHNGLTRAFMLTP